MEPLMKRIFHYSLVTVLTLLYSSFCFANPPQIIYGLEQAKTFRSSSTATYYIQAGSFLNHLKANRYQAYLTAKTPYSVKQRKQGHFHIVTVGPIPSAAAVRATAQAILKTDSIKPAQKLAQLNHQPVMSSLPASQIHPAPLFIYHDQPSKAVMKDQINMAPSSYWVFSLGAGAQFPQFDHNIRLNNNSDFPPPYDQDLYSTHENHQPIIALSVSRRFERHHQWLPSYAVGVMYQRFPSANIGNAIMQYSDPEFTNYNYSWDISSDVLLASLKLNLVQYGIFSPYLTGAIGSAFNRASNYIEMPVPSLNAPRVDPGFSSNTTSQFAYSAGAGFDIQLARTVILSAEYRFQDLGKFVSGKGNGTWSNRSLTLNSFRTNMVLINMNYLFDA
jgi:opacity protein-like surface antigen